MKSGFFIIIFNAKGYEGRATNEVIFKNGDEIIWKMRKGYM